MGVKDKVNKLALIAGTFVLMALLLLPISVRGAELVWTQTDQADFEAGTGVDVDTATSSGDVLLSLVANPTLITSDDIEVTETTTTPTLKKTLNFTKSGASYNELRIDNNLSCSVSNFAAYSDIQVDDVSKFTHDTDVTGTVYPAYDSYQDILDFSGYADGAHTYKFYLYTDKDKRIAYNSVFQLYRTKTYASSGTLTSSTHDTTYNNANFLTISWTATTPANTTLQFQVATNKDNATWVFLGPDGTAGTYYTTSGSDIWVGHDGDRYIKYKAYLSTTDNALTPTLSSVSINYDEITWASYDDAGHTSPEDVFIDYATQNTVYMEGTGFTNGVQYKVIYWYYDDPDWYKRYTDTGVVTASDSTLQNSYSFTPPDVQGNWQASVYYPDSYNPSTYSAADENLVANDISYSSQYSFYAYTTAIPEFPTVMAAIGVAGLCFGIYFWMREKRLKLTMQSAKLGDSLSG